MGGEVGNFAETVEACRTGVIFPHFPGERGLKERTEHRNARWGKARKKYLKQVLIYTF